MSSPAPIKREESAARQETSLRQHSSPQPPLQPHRNVDFVAATEMAKQDALRILQFYQASPKPLPAQLLNEARELATALRPEEKLVGRKSPRPLIKV
jgi:hypothetical protein